MHKLREDQNKENADFDSLQKDMTAKTELKIEDDNSKRNLEYLDFEIKKVDLSSKKWDADHINTCLAKEHDLTKRKIEHDLNIEFARNTFKKEVDNLDEDVLRYRAFENIPQCMNDRRVITRSS